MKAKITLIIGFLLLFFSSCMNYLDPYPNGDKSYDDIWKYQAMVQGLVGACYDNMPRTYGDNEGVYLDGATDDAVLTSSTNDMRRLAIGALPTSKDPFRTYWERDYKSIKLVNTFLKDRRGYNTKFIINERFNYLVKTRLQGEAFALRAWFEWDLLQKFGGKGTNGQMLGFPIITEPVEIEGTINYARNTYNECVKQIIADCDSAYKYLPIAHRDYLVPVVAERAYAGGRFWGRFDGISTRALKAMVYLTWASPRFNQSSDISRWDSAASNSKKVIDFKLIQDGAQAGGFSASTGVNWLNPNFPGIVLSSRYQSSNDVMERMFYPGGFQGNGEIGPTQELVNSFADSLGYPITHRLTVYDATKPYAKRDPRFYSAIYYNTAEARRSSGAKEVMYTFQNWEGAKDAAGAIPSNSLTNYHIKKYVYMGLNWGDNSIDRQPHSKFFMRWAHMCLIFAEAANQSVGPVDAAKFGISAKTAIQYLRTRKTYDGAAGFTLDPYLDEVSAAGKTSFDTFIRNERRIETCFEGIRFYDLRRWTTTLDALNAAVHGASIQKNLNTYTYNLNKEVEKRAYSSAYLPIPYTEMLGMSNLIQNEGWVNWN